MYRRQPARLASEYQCSGSFGRDSGMLLLHPCPLHSGRRPAEQSATHSHPLLQQSGIQLRLRSSGATSGPAHLLPRQTGGCVLTRRMGVAHSGTSQSTPTEVKKRAIVSVSDKTGLDELAKGLHEQGYQILSTGGSYKAIQAAGVAVSPIDSATKWPEMLEGRVKTLHPAVHGGILARRDKEEHMRTISKYHIHPIDVVVVNLYPFRQTVTASTPPSFETGVENIDIGGPAMIRAAAKNHEFVAVAVDPADYPQLLQQLQQQGGSSSDGPEASAWRRKLAWKAFQHCSTYDAAVAEWLWRLPERESLPKREIQEGDTPAPALTVPLQQLSSLRYGENPHQAAAVYVDQSLEEVGRGGVATAVQHHGKEMSYNNYLDCDAAYSAACDLAEPSCVIVKHTNPCGVAARADLREAYRLAVRADPTSAFGGIVAFNREVDKDLAEEIRQFRSPADDETRMFYEIVVAPSYTPDGLAHLKGKSKTLRILESQPRAPTGRSLRQISGGWLYQQADSLPAADITFTPATSQQPSEQQLQDARFAWTCVKHVKSNAITIAKGGRLLGMGSGQPNRVKSTQIALEKAGEEAQGAVLASDAFFPFSWNDSVEMACKAGVAVIVHPGGSLRDKDAADCCEKYGVVLLTTAIRHFRH